MDPEEVQLVTPQVERRQYRRVKLVTQVQCAALERDEVMLTRDVSVGGMFINTRAPIPIDSELSLTFRLSPVEPAIMCHGKVVFSRAGQGMGIQFVDLNAEAIQRLQKFVDES
jgi:c-di-GMP-binding flagellar brake protein YcgR